MTKCFNDRCTCSCHQLDEDDFDYQEFARRAAEWADMGREACEAFGKSLREEGY